jgi:hypothetical protein
MPRFALTHFLRYWQCVFLLFLDCFLRGSPWTRESRFRCALNYSPLRWEHFSLSVSRKARLGARKHISICLKGCAGALKADKSICFESTYHGLGRILKLVSCYFRAIPGTGFTSLPFPPSPSLRPPPLSLFFRGREGGATKSKEHSHVLIQTLVMPSQFALPMINCQLYPFFV